MYTDVMQLLHVRLLRDKHRMKQTEVDKNQDGMCYFAMQHEYIAACRL
jgi:hypothetical protein